MALKPDEGPLVQLQEDGVRGCCKVKVSSVLNRDVKQFGKKLMFDGDEETCWNSDQGTPQYITFELPNASTISSVHIKFQGGFAAKDCVLLSQCDSDRVWNEIQHFYPEDSNSLQVFHLSPSVGSKPTKLYKLEFRTSTDFFGRVTIYYLQLYGQTHHHGLN